MYNSLFRLFLLQGAVFYSVKVLLIGWMIWVGGTTTSYDQIISIFKSNEVKLMMRNSYELREIDKCIAVYHILNLIMETPDTPKLKNETKALFIRLVSDRSNYYDDVTAFQISDNSINWYVQFLLSKIKHNLGDQSFDDFKSRVIDIYGDKMSLNDKVTYCQNLTNRRWGVMVGHD